jgi:hypothetical protein
MNGPALGLGMALSMHTPPYKKRLKQQNKKSRFLATGHWFFSAVSALVRAHPCPTQESFCGASCVLDAT